MWEGEEGVRPKPHPSRHAELRVLERAPAIYHRQTQSHERNAQDEVRESDEALEPIFFASVRSHNFFTS